MACGVQGCEIITNSDTIDTDVLVAVEDREVVEPLEWLENYHAERT